mmetsp:Transcript_41660/g.128714  ORF Transcript_41660/g.128714 Transcript_41660/m.128714 type:complete len:259 (+) Transcript_41660:742-1518(+)
MSSTKSICRCSLAPTRSSRKASRPCACSTLASPLTPAVMSERSRRRPFMIALDMSESTEMTASCMSVRNCCPDLPSKAPMKMLPSWKPVPSPGCAMSAAMASSSLFVASPVSMAKTPAAPIALLLAAARAAADASATRSTPMPAAACLMRLRTLLENCRSMPGSHGISSSGGKTSPTSDDRVSFAISKSLRTWGCLASRHAGSTGLFALSSAMRSSCSSCRSMSDPNTSRIMSMIVRTSERNTCRPSLGTSTMSSKAL